MAGAANAIMGDDNFGTDLPQTEVPQQELAAEERMVRFSKTKEFAVLKEFVESRIQFYETYLPGGERIETVGAEERGNMWMVANLVNAEFKALLNAYTQAEETLKAKK